VEVATFRSEGRYDDGRRPDEVHFETDPALDAKRRDFTINGLMQNPDSGQVLDFVNGQEDLRRRTIRAIGDPRSRFAEDHLRMLRAIRFAARLGFSLDAATMTAIRELAPAITRISAERIRDELIRILTEGGAKRGLELLDDSGLLQILLPEVKAFQGVAQPPEFHPEGDVWTHVLLMLDQLRSPSAGLATGVLLHDVGKPPTFRVADRIRFDGHAEVGAEMTRQILHRLRFSNHDAEHITSLVANHMKFKDVMQMRTSTLKRFLCMPQFEEHLELHRLDCEASNGYTAAYEFVKSKLAEYADEELRPPRLITGNDLIAEGYKPGPDFGAALAAVETAQLEGQITERQEALAIVREVLNHPS
jgi:poly(A) polymerase